MLIASKKGIVEAADLLVVNKADGTLLQNAQHTKADYAGALQFVRQKHHSWRPKVMLCSAYTDFNVDEVLKKILEYQETMVQNGYLHKKRAVQAKKWMVGHVNRKILNYFSRNQDVKQSITLNEQLIEDSRITPIAAASKIFRVVKSFLGNTHQN